MQRKAFLVDGIDNTQRGGPGRLGIFSPETIQEVKVISNSMAAEYGRTVGGMISMITRGGTNDTMAKGLVLERRPGLIARPSLAPQPSPFSSGPLTTATSAAAIKKDKLFYFVSGEYEPEDGAASHYDYARERGGAEDSGVRSGHPRPSSSGSRPIWDGWIISSTRITTSMSRYSNFVTPSQYNTSGGLTPKSAGNNFDDRNDTFASQWTSMSEPNIGE